jgi:hypothetical protein
MVHENSLDHRQSRPPFRYAGKLDVLSFGDIAKGMSMLTKVAPKRHRGINEAIQSSFFHLPFPFPFPPFFPPLDVFSSKSFTLPKPVSLSLR